MHCRAGTLTSTPRLSKLAREAAQVLGHGGYTAPASRGGRWWASCASLVTGASRASFNNFFSQHDTRRTKILSGKMCDHKNDHKISPDRIHVVKNDWSCIEMYFMGSKGLCGLYLKSGGVSCGLPGLTGFRRGASRASVGVGLAGLQGAPGPFWGPRRLHLKPGALRELRGLMGFRAALCGKNAKKKTLGRITETVSGQVFRAWLAKPCFSEFCPPRKTPCFACVLAPPGFFQNHDFRL